MSEEYELYGQSATVSREEAARRLHAIADELASNNGLQVTREGKRLTVKVPDQVELGVEIEQDGDGMELEIEIGWSGGPLAG
jgi:amphi-Trp domain-containing protein